MPHWSEDAHKLDVVETSVGSLSELAALADVRPDVWVLRFPFWRSAADWNRDDSDLSDRINQFLQSLSKQSVVCLLTSPEDAALLYPQLKASARFQLWVAVKLRQPVPIPGRLASHHAALIFLSRYDSSLNHTKTRIAYTYCPYCEKTTKDYGGKKHTYHSYGTLMSDVWRDIEFDPEGSADALLDRLADVFGLKPHRTLRMLDLTGVPELVPKRSLSDSCRFNNPQPRESRRPPELIQGDCLKVLGSLPDSSIDFCFADPPYNIDKRYDRWNDNLDFVEYFDWCDKWLTELARVLRPGHTCAVLNIPLWMIRHIQCLKHELEFQNWIAWEALSLPVRMIMPAHYSIACFSKGPPRELPFRRRSDPTEIEFQSTAALNEDYCVRSMCVRARRAARIKDTSEPTDLWWDVHRLKHNSRRVDHPCQLPPRLMQRLIAIFTSPGETVLDPFNGSGTTSLCAELLDRSFVGIELSEDYHKLALERHRKLRGGIDPFAKSDRVPQAKNSRVKRIGGQKYSVPKKVLQLEVKEIAQRLGRLPSRDEVCELSQYAIEMFDDYFISWGEVCAAARTTGMSEDKNGRAAHSSNRRQLPLFEE